MDEELDRVAARTPMHLWVIGVVALAWNAIGIVDYLMTRFHNEDYLHAVMPGVDPATIYGYVDAMPLVASIGWGLGVWGALAGTLLLLARSRHAVAAFLVSLLGAVASFIVQFTGPKPPAAMDDPIMPIVITCIALALLGYAKAMRARGVLR